MRRAAAAARVAATGVSNGGGFAARLACEASDRVGAAVAIAGSYRALDPCRPARAVSILEIHGTGDTIVPYRVSVLRFLRTWVRLDRCSPHARRSAPRRGVTRLRWRGCAAGAAVEHLRLAGTGHGWPGVGGNRSHPPHDPTGVSATRALFAFIRTGGLGRPG